MNTTKKIIEFVLHGNPDKFKTVLKEEMTNRATDILHNLYLSETQQLLKAVPELPSEVKESVISTPNTPNFYPEKIYQLKDGNVGILDGNERDLVSKLYENLNNDNKERMVKLLSESQESFNRVLKLARLEESKRTNK
jgi:hypothetical protein